MRASSPASGVGEDFQFVQEAHGLVGVMPAHFGRRHQPAANCRAPGLPKNEAARVIAQLNAAHARRFAVWHAGYGRADGGGGAAGAASGAAIQGYRF